VTEGTLARDVDHKQINRGRLVYLAAKKLPALFVILSEAKNLSVV